LSPATEQIPVSLIFYHPLRKKSLFLQHEITFSEENLLSSAVLDILLKEYKRVAMPRAFP